MRKKKQNVYSVLAEAIYDFSVHRLNRIELYEIMSNCIVESTDDDKAQVLAENELARNDYQFSKNWLERK